MSLLRGSLPVLSAVSSARATSSRPGSIINVARTAVVSGPSGILPPLPSLLQVRYKSKRSFASEINDPGQIDFEAESDRPVMNTKGKGGKASKTNSPRGAKSKKGDREQAEMEDPENYKTSTRNTDLPEENYDEKALSESLHKAVQRCKETVTKKVGMQGRADPALLDPVRVSPNEGDESYPLREYASVGTRDGAIIVTCFDKDTIKLVERAILLADLGLVPQTTGSSNDGILKIPIPRPTAETRTKLIKDINRICEKARASIRTIRHSAQKQIKLDVAEKIIGSSEASKELREVEEQVKERQKEVDDFYNNLKKKIESERDM